MYWWVNIYVCNTQYIVYIYNKYNEDHGCGNTIVLLYSNHLKYTNTIHTFWYVNIFLVYFFISFLKSLTWQLKKFQRVSIYLMYQSIFESYFQNICIIFTLGVLILETTIYDAICLSKNENVSTLCIRVSYIYKVFVDNRPCAWTCEIIETLFLCCMNFFLNFFYFNFRHSIGISTTFTKLYARMLVCNDQHTCTLLHHYTYIWNWSTVQYNTVYCIYSTFFFVCVRLSFALLRFSSSHASLFNLPMDMSTHCHFINSNTTRNFCFPKSPFSAFIPI